MNCELTLEDLVIILHSLRLRKQICEAKQNSKETRREIRQIEAVIQKLEEQDPHFQTLRRVERELL